MNWMRAVVVGASGGIGTSVCEQIAELGGQAFLIGRNQEKLKQLADRFGWGFGACDASDWHQLDQNISSAEEVLGGIDTAINLAGSVLLKPIHLTSFSDWDSTIRANVYTAAGLIRFCAPRMFAHGGSIVLMSSVAAAIGIQNHEAIAAAKGAIEGLVLSAAATYASKRIRVNAVAPGLVRTPLTERIWANEKSLEISKQMHPLGRIGEPDEVARAVCFLASEKQSWITGQVLGVDGGMGALKTSNQRPSS